ncbi:MAG: polysaccharide biosynthesis C-terminal domain-containing protein [Oscillospiraceae bacterium]|nr:polysaccharide biosynthesis C-terminal domain-containing protein [Oscillospiraceae bacterium]
MKKNNILKNAVILFTAMIITKLLSAVLKIPLTNILGGVGMGYFSAAYSVFMPVYALTAAALPAVIMRMTARNVVSGNFANAVKIRRVGVLCGSMLGITGTAIIILIASPFAKYVSGSANSLPAMLIIAPSLFFCCISAVYRGYYEGLSNMLPTAITQIIEAVVKSAIGIVLALVVVSKGGDNLLPYASAAAVAGITAGELCGLLFMLIRTRLLPDSITAYEIKNSPAPQNSLKIVKTIFKDTLPITLAALAMNINPLIDLMTITNMCGTFVYGSYTGISTSIFALVTAITAMLSKSALPEITLAYEKRNTPDLIRSLKILFKGTFIICFPLCLGLAAIAEPLLSLLYFSKPAEVAVSTLPLIVLCLGGASLVLAGTLFSIFTAIGRADLQVKLMLVGAAVKLCGNLVLIRIPQLSVTGAALATVACYSIVSVIGLFMLKGLVKEKLEMPRFFLQPLIFAGLCGLGAYFSHYHVFVNLPPMFRITASVAVGALVYIICTSIADKKYIGYFLIKKATEV